MRQTSENLSLPGDTETCQVATLGEGSLCRGPEGSRFTGHLGTGNRKGLWMILVQKECTGQIQVIPHVRGRCKDPGQEPLALGIQVGDHLGMKTEGWMREKI